LLSWKLALKANALYPATARNCRKPLNSQLISDDDEEDDANRGLHGEADGRAHRAAVGEGGGGWSSASS